MNLNPCAKKSLWHCCVSEKFSRTLMILVIVFCLQISSRATAQSITITKNNIVLTDLFAKIKEQTGYRFFWKGSDLSQYKVSVTLKKVSIKDAMDAALKNLPLSYSITEHTIVITDINSPHKAADYSSPMLMSNVSGQVTDSKNSAIVGASVLVKRLKTGTTTGEGGVFSLKSVRPTDSLIISYIGYSKMTVPVNGKSFLLVKLEESTNGLDEIVVQAYGQTTQRLTTSNIGRLGASEIAKQTVLNPIAALEGRIAGVSVTPQSGYEDGAITIQIRGRSTIDKKFTSDPLYIIDGVPLTILDVSGTKSSMVGNNNYSAGTDQTGLSLSAGQSPLASINPADIESIEVLKDADATAIYGSRGANGVVLITTKRGKNGPNQFSLNVSQGVNFVTRYWDQLNTQQYLSMRREAFRNDGILPTSSNAPDLTLWDQNASTNWQKYAYGNVGKRTSIQTALSGGNEQTTFRIGAGYNNSESIGAVGGGSRRATVSFNVSNSSLNKRFQLSLSGNYGLSISDQISTNGSAILAPNAPQPFDATGALNYTGYGGSSTNFKFASLLQPYSSKSNGLTTNLTLSYTILKGLNAHVNLGYNNVQNNQKSETPIASLNPYESIAPTGSASLGITSSNNVIIEPQLEYTRQISKGTLTALIGGTYQNNTTDALRTDGTGYTSDAFIQSISLAPIVKVADSYGQYKYAGVFGRVNYNWENKYILNLNGRRDGSSRFGLGNRFGNFGSAGAAWLMTEEKWLRSVLPEQISFMKLRGSYGLTGSDNVGDYQYLSQLGNGNTLANYNGVAPLTPQIQPNQNFHWQVNKKLEFAFDMSLFKDNVSFEVAYYRDRCNNQLLSFPTPAISGFSVVTANSPANVQNDGWEFTESTKIINHKSFGWTMNFNISFNRNILLGYPDLEHSAYATQYKIGSSLSDTYIYQFTGINPLTGQASYVDHNHDGVITQNSNAFPGTQNSDNYVVVSLIPKYEGGLNNQFRYKNLSISTFFSFRKQMGKNALQGNNGGLQNISVDSYNGRWQYPGQQGAILPRLTTVPTISDFYYSASTAVYTDASFIRLQTLALAYSIPARLLKKIGVSNLSFNINAQNIFILTRYKGMDPEIQNIGAQPLSRTINGGINASF